MKRSIGFLTERIGVLLLFVILAQMGCGTTSDDKKIGYIDTTDLLGQFDMAIKVRTELQTTTGQWQTEINKMGQELDIMRQRFIDESVKLSASQQKQLRGQLAEKEQAYAQYVQEVSQKAQALEAEKMQPVYQALNGILREYGQKQGYYIIWGATPSGNIVYADTTSNLTKDVLAYIEENKPMGAN